MKYVQSPWARAAVAIAGIAGAIALLWWRGPAWGAIGDAFGAVEWRWVLAAVALNLLSVVVRTAAWRTVIVQAIRAALPTLHARLLGVLGRPAGKRGAARQGSASLRASRCSTGGCPRRAPGPAC